MPGKERLGMSDVPVVEMRGMAKHFGGVIALDKVDFAVYPNEVVAIAGDNGAGKTTLIKILSGVFTPDEGDIFFEGRKVSIGNPMDARNMGIETIYQDLALADNMDVPTNVFLGRELMKPLFAGFLKLFDKKKMILESRRLLDSMRIRIDSLGVPVQFLSGGQRQIVAIARSIYFKTKVLIMDEPTAALGVEETDTVLGLIRNLKEGGISIVLICHNLTHVFTVSDRIVVLKTGRKISERPAEGTDPDEIAKIIITGRDEKTTPNA